jgi:hypothetical protein
MPILVGGTVERPPGGRSGVIDMRQRHRFWEDHEPPLRPAVEIALLLALITFTILGVLVAGLSLDAISY